MHKRVQSKSEYVMYKKVQSKSEHGQEMPHTKDH